MIFSTYIEFSVSGTNENCTHKSGNTTGTMDQSGSSEINEWNAFEMSQTGGFCISQPSVGPSPMRNNWIDKTSDKWRVGWKLVLSLDGVWTVFGRSVDGVWTVDGPWGPRGLTKIWTKLSSFSDGTWHDCGSSCSKDELEKPFCHACVWQINSKLVLVSDKECNMVTWLQKILMTSSTAGYVNKIMVAKS